MIRFSVWAAYLHLVPQERVLIRDRALISFFLFWTMLRAIILIYYLLKKGSMTETVTVTNIRLMLG